MLIYLGQHERYMLYITRELRTLHVGSSFDER